MENPHGAAPPTIRTPDQTLRVFVSSTLKEMQAERAAAREAIEHMRLAPVMFELGARPHAAQDLYRAYLAQSHVFVGIYGEQYGWIGPGMSISGLEEEYRLADGLPKLVYIREPAPDRDPRLRAMLDAMRDRDRVSYKKFASADELRELVANDLRILLVESFEASRGATPHTGRAAESTGDGPSDGDDRSGAPTVDVPLTRLLGRDAELASVRARLADGRRRLVTLTGPGGSGKTRLSLEVARSLAARFDEVHVVELAPIKDPSLVMDAIARRVGLSEAGAKPIEDRLADNLRDRDVLLVLDNFEQVAGAAASVAHLLERCPRLAVLATSRTPLRVRGELEFPLAPLPLPEPDATPEALRANPAVQLFADRAASIKPDFRVTGDNAAAVAQICRQLDGLPLAIELAAARVRLLTPERILDRLDRRLSFLAGDAPDLPERQRTIRSTIAWSYELLAQDEAAAFRRLAVFEGGWSLEAAEAVAGNEAPGGRDALDVLERLASQSLVRVRDLDTRGIRFEMLETIRDFAFELLEGSEDLPGALERHARYVLELAEGAEPRLRSGSRGRWLERLTVEIDNVRAVLRRSLARRIDAMYGIRLAGTLGWFWHLRGHLSEGRTWAARLAALPESGGRTRERARVLFPAGGLAWSQGDYAAANAFLEESASIFDEVGDLEGLTDARGILAGGLASTGAHARALRLCRDTEARLREAGDRWGLGFTLLWSGSIGYVIEGNAGAARATFEEARAHAEAVGDPWIRAEALHHLGDIAGLTGAYDAARACFEESLRFHEVIGDQWAIARGLTGFGEAALRHGDVAAAASRFREALSIWSDVGHALGVRACLAGLAQAAHAAGDGPRAARLHGAASVPVRTIGYLFLEAGAEEHASLLDRVRSRVGIETFDREHALGRAMGRDEAVAFALSGTRFRDDRAGGDRSEDGRTEDGRS